MLPFLISPRFCKEKGTGEMASTVSAGLGRGWGASHQLGDVCLPPVRVLQGIVLGVGQAPPAATGSRSQHPTATAGRRRASGSPVAGCHDPVVGGGWGTHVSQTSLSTEARGSVCKQEGGHELGSGVRLGRGGLGVPGGTWWRSMSCGMAPTIWMAIFTTSLGGGMAPAPAPSPPGTAPRPARLPAPPRRSSGSPPPPPRLPAGPEALTAATALDGGAGPSPEQARAGPLT